MSSKNNLVPKLRFPEFRGAWVEDTLGQLTEYENGKAHEQEIFEKGEFIVVNSKFISTNAEVKKFTHTAFCIAQKNDILMVLSDVPNGRAIGKCFLVDVDNLYTVNQRICKLTSINTFSIMLFYILNRNQYFLSFDDGVKQTNLKKDDVLNCPILLPEEVKEQKKIADCLSSLDDLITAEAQKLDSLKAHKKGLMQQLFPAEGKTQPKRRFPEFRGAGAWEKKRLDKICQKISQGGTPDTSNPDYWGGHIEWLTPAEMGKLETRFIASTNRKITEAGLQKCSSNLLPINSVILSTRAPIGHLLINQSEMAINQGCKGLVPKATTDYGFLYYGLFKQKIALADLGSGNTFKELSATALRNFQILIPKLPEQQKIADCLSPIDQIITAEAQKLHSLKAHKKGLMQQLFPSSNEIDA